MKRGYEFDTFSYKGDSIKDGRTGPGNGLRCMDIWWDYWNEGWRFPEDFGAWDCTLVIMFIRFSVLFVEARESSPLLL